MSLRDREDVKFLRKAIATYKGKIPRPRLLEILGITASQYRKLVK
jgi:hypothetical protein